MATRLGERIEFASKWRGIGQSDLAKLVGVTPQAISYQINQGKSTGKIAAYARALRVHLDWLESDNSELDESAFLPDPAVDSPAAAPPQVDALLAGRLSPIAGPELLPIFAGARAGENGAVYLAKEPVDHIPIPPNLAGVPRAYGMVVVGESMRPMFRPFQIVHVNPQRRPVPGKGIVIWLADDGVLLKEYVRHTGSHLVVREYQPKERDFEVHLAHVAQYHLVVGTEESP